MKVNSHNTFSPLQEVILGSVDISVTDTVEHPQKKYILEEIVHETAEDLDNIEKLLKSFNVNVLRPTYNGINFSQQCVTPYFKTNGHRVPLTPRDIFFCYQDTIVNTTNADRNRFFETLFFSEILKKYLDNDSHVLSMPMAPLDDSIYDEESITEEFAYYNNSFPMASAANFQKYGKDIFYCKYSTINDSALKWFKKQLGPEYRFIPVGGRITGHIDGAINILKPGVIASVFPKKDLPDYFQNWTVITDQDVFKHRSYNQIGSLISDNIQDDDFQNTVLGLNMFCIDEQHALVYDSLKPSLLKQMENVGITPIPVPFRHSHYLGQGFTCITLDTVRRGDLEDYTQ